MGNEIDAEFIEGNGGGIGADYLIFPETARNFEASILADLRRGYNVRVIFQEPARIGPLMVVPQLSDRIRRGVIVHHKTHRRTR